MSYRPSFCFSPVRSLSPAVSMICPISMEVCHVDIRQSYACTRSVEDFEWIS